MRLLIHNYIHKLQSSTKKANLLFSFETQCLILFFLCTFALSINTIGFDFYHHSLSVESFDSIPRLNSSWIFFNQYEVPRYLLGHYLLVVFSLGFIPIAWVIIILQTIITVKIIRNTSSLGSLFTFMASLFITYYMIFFSMSGLSLEFLFLSFLCFYNGRPWKKWFFLAASFHPIGFILCSLMSIFIFPFKKTILTLLTVAIVALLIRMIELTGNSTDPLLNFNFYFDTLISRISNLIYLIFFPIILNFFFLKKSLILPVIMNPLIIIFLGLLSASIYSWEAQIKRGSFLTNILLNESYHNSSLINESKDNLICASWIDQNCFNFIDNNDLSFRQSEKE
ncbi:hypothetical protein OAH81_03675 [Candidatus Pseudothioglobus singularis]|nr:hypothetical protein [Candidatus Pseudothioglobus singularis]MDB4822119.1 hypothetical protein [Candidatus Pseudothioglobus singularis]